MIISGKNNKIKGSVRVMKFQMKKIYLIIASAVLACICLVLAGLMLFNKYTLEMPVADGDVLHMQYGSEKLDVLAIYKGTIFDREGIPVELIIEGDVDYTKIGEYEVSISAKYKDQIKTAEVILVVEDTLAPVIELVEDPDYVTNPSAQYVEQGFTAIDNYDGDVTDKVVRVEKDGVVTYTVTDTWGNTAEVKRTIVYKDIIAPVITLNGDQEMKVSIGSEFADPGFTAADECDGDLTSSVAVEGTVDANNYGIYDIVYKVTDSSGNEGTITRKVIVEDLEAPVIQLSGDKNTYVKLGETYTDPGYAASDNADGDVTAKVSVSGSVNTAVSGNYAITYTVADEQGNTATITRNVYVYEKQAENVAVNPGDKVIYLTFDDGPGPYTQRLLDILDKYNVKASFFVTGQFSKHLDMIGEAHRRGHTIALHTYTHEFSEIYASTDNYYADLERIKNVCVQQTGVEPKIIRFPGGTANTVSKKYCTGIMTEIAQGVGYRGYLYCDWHVDSQDSIGVTDPDMVAQNVINGVQKRDVSIVLQHDIQKHSVDAVEQIICWGLANGYKFLPMDETTPMVHQTIKN